uniref:DUF1016 N-terminal domain-containing protein n=1 Tax=Gemmiger formicilis TaxID=745368 RepID=UPI00402673DA
MWCWCSATGCWGYRIAQEELDGEGRSEYGTALIRKLAKGLTAEYGKGFDYSSLYKYFRFYKLYPEIVDSLSPQSAVCQRILPQKPSQPRRLLV